MEENSCPQQLSEKVEEDKNNFNEKETNSGPEETSSQVSNPEGADKPAEETRVQYNRLKLFDKVMQKSLKKFVEIASDKGFAAMFRPLYKKNPQKMETIHKKFAEELQKTIQEDISRLTEEGMLEFKLDELDKLEDAAKNDLNPAWRPSGIPEQDFCSFLMPYYQKQEAFLRLELKKIQAENAALAQRVQTGRENISQTEQRISTAVDEWKAAVAEFENLASSLCPADVFNV
ncbi:Polyamine-modulated factor 1 [Oryzias melastigma]|uniref:Polyamine-modulated factor 1 n=1 Tax=Oryzias melastigma TaxID=30732 RepID=A0A3B3CQN8_ORYME|nr:polyamine-modulated factor 1 [Oryzias melastigma]KAF6726765.1 Polyamine-modulated factor 1 [Oryzias melastigma]